MTVAIMRSLYDNLITKHMDIGEFDDISETSITDAKHDFQAYSVYACSFMTLARPKSTLSLMHKDIKLPIDRRSRNVEFVEEYVFSPVSLLAHIIWHRLRRCPGSDSCGRRALTFHSCFPFWAFFFNFCVRTNTRASLT